MSANTTTTRLDCDDDVVAHGTVTKKGGLILERKDGEPGNEFVNLGPEEQFLEEGLCVDAKRDSEKEFFLQWLSVSGPSISLRAAEKLENLSKRLATLKRVDPPEEIPAGSRVCNGNIAFYCPKGDHRIIGDQRCMECSKRWHLMRRLMTGSRKPNDPSLQRITESTHWKVSAFVGLMEIIASKHVVSV